MTLRDDQGVPGRDREAVPYDQPQRAGVNHSRLRQATEWARLHLSETIAFGFLSLTRGQLPTQFISNNKFDF